MWTPFKYLIDREFCDSTSVREAIRSLARKTESTRAILLVRRRERIQRSLAIVFDEDKPTVELLEKWLFQTANNKLQSFAFLPRLAMQSRFLKVEELLLSDSEDSIILDRLAHNLKRDAVVRVVSCRKLCYPEATDDVYDAFVMLFRESSIDIDTEHFMEVSLMVACSAPVLVQAQVEELERNRTVIERTTATIKSSRPILERSRGSDTVLDRFCSIVPCDFATLIHQQRLQNNDSWDEPKRPIEFRSARLPSPPDLMQLIQCRSFRFATQRLRPLLFNRRSASERDNALEFSIGDIEEVFGRVIASIIIVPFHSTNDLFVLLAVRFFSSELQRSFTSSDLTSSYESVRAAFARHQEDKVRLAFSEMKNVLKEPAAFEPTLPETTNPKSGAATTVHVLPQEFRKAQPGIHTLLQAAAKATGSRLARLCFVKPELYELVEVSSNLAFHDRTVPTRVSMNSSSILATVARDGTTIYNNELPLLSIVDRNDIDLNLVRSEICFPIYLSGLLVGVLELKHRMEKAYDGWEHFLDLICLALSQQLAIARQDVDAQLLAETPDVFELEHLRKHTLNFLTKLKELKVGPIEAAKQKVFDDEFKSLLDEASSIATRQTLGNSAENLVEVFKHISQPQRYPIHVENAKPLRLNLPLIQTYSVNPSINKALHSVFVSYFKNLEHTIYQDISLSYDELLWGGERFLRLTFESPCNSLPTVSHREFNQLIYRQPYRTGNKTHFGCYIMGRVMREAGGDITGEVKYHGASLKFRTTLFFPVSTRVSP